MDLPSKIQHSKVQVSSAPERQERLKELEDRVRVAAYEMWMALNAIQVEKLYLDRGCSTFIEYCKKYWNMNRVNAYQYAKAGRVIENLLTLKAELPLPSAVSQAVQLARIKDPEQRQQAWQKSVETAPGGHITAEHVKKTVDQVLQRNEHEPESLVENPHTYIQWILARLGKKLSGRVWIGRDNHSEQWAEDRLGDLSVSALPSFGMGDNAQKIVEYIDLLWLNEHNQITAAFEIERTTTIYSGLLRMADLLVLCPNLNFNLYLVIPKARINEVKKQLSRPTFRGLNLHQKCYWLVMEDLMQEEKNIRRYGTHPSVLSRISHSLAMSEGFNTL